MRVIVADDSVIVRRGLVTLLQQENVDVLGEATNADALLALVATESPDAAIVDIRMPPGRGDEGLVAAEQIRTWFPRVAVLVLSQYVRTGYAMRLLTDNNGSVGYLLKERIADADTLLDALRRVCSGESVIDPELITRLRGGGHAQAAVAALTEREREVLMLMAEGHDNVGICARLSLSPKTVETHVSRIFRKLQIEQQSGHRRVLAVLQHLRADPDREPLSG